MSDRVTITARLSPGAHDALMRFAAHNRISVSALLEAIGQELAGRGPSTKLDRRSTPALARWVADAAAIDGDRRRRRHDI